MHLHTFPLSALSDKLDDAQSCEMGDGDAKSALHSAKVQMIVFL